MCHNAQVIRRCFSFLPPMKKNVQRYRIYPRLPRHCLRRTQTGTFPAEQPKRGESCDVVAAPRPQGSTLNVTFPNTVKTSANYSETQQIVHVILERIRSETQGGDSYLISCLHLWWCENAASNCQERWWWTKSWGINFPNKPDVTWHLLLPVSMWDSFRL